jgi:hypothetical protein
LLHGGGLRDRLLQQGQRLGDAPSQGIGSAQTRRQVTEEAEEIAALTEAKAGFEDGDGLKEIALPEMQIADAGTQYALPVEVIDRRGNAASLCTVLPPCGECATFGKGLAQGITSTATLYLALGLAPFSV